MELIKGNIYTAIDEISTGVKYIWKCGLDGENTASFRLYITKNGGGASFERNVGYHGWRQHMEPTYEERTWLEACIEANKLVSRPEISNNYEIY